MKRIKQLFKTATPVKWLFYGDSITHGSFHTHGWRSYSELFNERIRYELLRLQDIVINTAISGDTTNGLLSSFDWRVKQFTPDVIFLMIGMNDCCGGSLKRGVFEKNLNLLVDKFNELEAITVMQTTCPVISHNADEREPYQTYIGNYMDTVRKVAAESNLPLIDHYAFWLKNVQSQLFWHSDAIHPNEYGHRVFSHYIFRCLGIFDEASPTCSLDISIKPGTVYISSE